MFDSPLRALAEIVLAEARASRMMLTTAESCTGGLIAALLTEIPGSSDVVERGFVTYSNRAKTEMLGVDAALIAAEGAVSEAVARAMAEGALRHAKADAAVAVTGIAGPGGGSADKPVGLVHIAAARKGGETVHRECRFGDIGRDAVRLAAVRAALEMLRPLLQSASSPQSISSETPR
jgi:nicotinamide-nucleotide amidase